MTAKTQLALSDDEKERLRTVKKVSLHEARNVPAPKECEPDAGLFPAKDTEEIDLFLEVIAYLLKKLTPLKQQYLQMMLEGKTEKEMREETGTGRSTVNAHVRTIKRRIQGHMERPQIMRRNK